MTEISQTDYVEIFYSSAINLWGEEEAKKMRDHLVKTARSVWIIGKSDLDSIVEPATRLRHGK